MPGKEVSFEVHEEGEDLYAIERIDGAYTAQVKVYGRVTIAGRWYRYERVFKIRLRLEATNAK